MRNVKLDAKYVCLGIRSIGIQALTSSFTNRKILVKVQNVVKAQSYYQF